MVFWRQLHPLQATMLNSLLLYVGASQSASGLAAIAPGLPIIRLLAACGSQPQTVLPGMYSINEGVDPG
jgi:hypothetical protein